MSKPFATRIRSVTQKSGGASIRIIHNDAGRLAGKYLVDNAKSFADKRPDLAGYVIVAWDQRGGTSSVIFNGQNSSVLRHAIPEMVKEAATEYLSDRDNS